MLGLESAVRKDLQAGMASDFAMGQFRFLTRLLLIGAAYFIQLCRRCSRQGRESYNLQLFWMTMLDTLWQSLVLFYVPLHTYSRSTLNIWSLGCLWTIFAVILVNMHFAMDIHRIVAGYVSPMLLCGDQSHMPRMIVLDPYLYSPTIGILITLQHRLPIGLPLC